MMNTTWKLRLSTEELESWKTAAAAEGKLLSEWVRESCNGEAAGYETEPKKLGNRKDVSGAKNVPADTGRKPTASGVPAHLCANCEHAKSKHWGFRGACQSDNCLCPGFE